MELTPELFDEITGFGSLPPTSDPAETERRRHRRFPFGSRASISRAAEPATESVALLRDISVAGVGFLYAEPMKSGEPFNIRFAGQRGRTIKIHCAAHRCEAGGSGGAQFVIGATFQQILEIKEAPVEPPKETVPAPAPPPSRKSNLFSSARSEPAPPAMPPPPAEPAAALTIPAAAMPSPQPASAEDPRPVTDGPAEPPPSAALAEPVMPMSMLVKPAGAPVDYGGAARAASEAAATSAAHMGKNQELLAQVKARVLKQSHVLHTSAHQLDECHRQLNEQKAAIERLTRERSEIQASLEAVQQQVSEEKQSAARQTESLTAELLSLRQAVEALRVKSEADDKAIAELASLLQNESEVYEPAMAGAPA